MKYFFIILIFLIYSQVYSSQNLWDSTYIETTAISKEEKNALKHIVDIYKVKQEKRKLDSDEDYSYVLDVFPKIDSLKRAYNLDDKQKKKYLFYKAEFKLNEEKGGYFGDDVKVVFNPDFSLNHGYINLEIEYPAAGVNILKATFILNGDVYESYCHFTSSAGGYTNYIFRENGVEKYSDGQDNPYEDNIYR